MKPATLMLFTAVSLALGTFPVHGQNPAPPPIPESESAPEPIPANLTSSGQILVDGHLSPYLIRHLPVSSFPDLPDGIRNQLDQRRCVIPQTYEAHRPENVIHANFEGSGSSDWAVLCTSEGTVSLLVFFSDSSSQPFTLASAPETKRLQAHDPTGVLGFNWGIDPASPDQVRDAQAGMRRRPPRLDHDAIGDTLVDHHTVYHYYLRSAWIVLVMKD
ncbi:MAG TPA: hypothetical protein VGT08_08135 [Terracidiphilus sp.]|nr:hypothetical protein [Terracidiphilus sp.]